MDRVLKNTLIALSCSTALFLTACTRSTYQDDDQPHIIEQYYISEEPYHLDKLDNAKTINIMKYNMQNVLGQTTEATALVIFPEKEKPIDGWRVVIWEHGTVGVADHCAPSLSPLDKDFSSLAKNLLSTGYVIVAPDYEGLGSAGIHPYLNLGSEARSAIAAIKAVNQHYAGQLHGAWMSVGQSQGGQASLGTSEYANNDPLYKGTVAAAPASSFGEIILDVAPNLLRQLEQQEIADGLTDLEKRSSVSSYATLLAYVALTGIGIQAYEPYFQYRDLFQARAKPIAALADWPNGFCLQSNDPEQSLVQNFKKDIISFMQANPEKSVMDYPGLDTEAFRTNAVVTQFLADNEPGTKRLDKSTMIIQGNQDTSVPYMITTALVDRLKEDLKSPDILYVLVEGAGHSQAIVQTKERVINFIKLHLPAA